MPLDMAPPRDSIASHEKFRSKEKLPFDLLSDAEEKLCKRFDVIKEKSLYGKKYLGIERSDDFIVIQITFNAGRTLDQKKALYKAIADGAHDAVGIRKEDVFINLVEVPKENWSFGNGIAQYAS